MARSSPPTLVEGSTVQLDIDGASGVLVCRVLAFVGPTMLVMPAAGGSREARASLMEGATGVDLLVEEGDYLHAVRGTARMAGEAIAVRITGKSRIGQRRWYSRADVALQARLVPQGGGPPPTETATTDISAGGVEVHRPAGMTVWPRYEITLSGASLDRSIVAEATPARVRGDSIGLRFSRIDAHDRELLTGLVVRRLADFSA